VMRDIDLATNVSPHVNGGDGCPDGSFQEVGTQTA
jgi:hypothetical protein